MTKQKLFRLILALILPVILARVFNPISLFTAQAQGNIYYVATTGSDGSLTQTVSVSLLVGGARVHLPIILKQ